VAGQKVVVTGITTTGGVPATGYNNTAVNPTWTIAAVPAPTAKSFSYVVPAGTIFPVTPSTGGSVSLYIPQITMLLRRLANPSLAWNTITNPYITVDYLDGIPVTVPLATLPATPLTVGRPQPYQASLPLPIVPAPQTFFQQNVPGGAPFDWLVHLDRAPVNPLEMLHVSGYKPHQLTQQFVTGGGKFQHYAPWNPFVPSPSTSTLTMADPNALIYRMLDQMSTHYMAGTYTGGRFPGNINLNTIMEPEIFQALCDAHDTTAAEYPNPWFTQANVNSIFNNLTISRGAPNTGGPPLVEPAAPFKSFSAAKTVGGQVSLDDTCLRSFPVGSGKPLFGVGSAANHPYLQASLLQKIYNNITTTSNVFAVWWTVGYFEVVDETVKPARLGQEIGRSQNRHIRHRFFAIVDRSGLQLFAPAAAKALVMASTTPQKMTIATPLSGIIGTAAVQFQPGMLLEIDTGTANAEVVAVMPASAVAPVVAAPTASTFTAVFTKNHAVNASITCRGNPGPQTIYNPHDDPNVVLHMSVIK
jgi:hypothetical protein